MDTISQELQIAIDAAKTGAKTALQYYRQDLEIEAKEDKSVVTIADRETESTIKSFIQSHSPNAQFIAEESGGVTNKDAYWIIDPIDGSRPFSLGYDLWDILIAYCKNGVMQVGVAYFPTLDILLYAEKGNGAFVNNKRIHVSSIDNLKQAFVAFGSIRHFPDKSVVLHFVNATKSSRSYDSIYSNYLIATGKMEAQIDSYGKLWDIAPFEVIIPEAGGKVTNLKGEKFIYGDKGYIISNGYLHDNIVDIVNKK